jgi:hypothetical protein
MKFNTAHALENFIRSVSNAVCRCTLAEADSGHNLECRYHEVNEKAEELISALNTDETLIR